MTHADYTINASSWQAGNKWEAKQLGDIISLEYGTGLSENQRLDGDFPVYGSSGQVGKHTENLIKGPGIIVGRKGSIGAVLWSSNPFWPIDTTYYVKVNAGYDLRWCYWLLLSLPLDRLDSSTGIPGLNRNDAYKLLVKIPTNTAEQHHIAEILDTIDTQIQETEKLIAKLKQMKAGLLHDLLTKGIDEHGEVRDPVAHPEQFKESALGLIPREWGIYELNSLCLRITDGCHQTVKTSKEGVPFLYVSCIRDGQILWDQAAKISADIYKLISKGREPEKDLILYTVVGSYGNAALVDVAQPFSFQRHIAYILPNVTEVNPMFLVNWLNSPWCRSYADRVALGNAQKTITLGHLVHFPVPLPGSEEQTVIAKAINTHNTRITAEEADLNKLKQIKKGLMHDLLTGRVRVTELAVDGEKILFP